MVVDIKHCSFVKNHVNMICDSAEKTVAERRGGSGTVFHLRSRVQLHNEGFRQTNYQHSSDDNEIRLVLIELMSLVLTSKPRLLIITRHMAVGQTYDRYSWAPGCFAAIG